MFDERFMIFFSSISRRRACTVDGLPSNHANLGNLEFRIWTYPAVRHDEAKYECELILKTSEILSTILFVTFSVVHPNNQICCSKIRSHLTTEDSMIRLNNVFVLK